MTMIFFDGFENDWEKRWTNKGAVDTTGRKVGNAVLLSASNDGEISVVPDEVAAGGTMVIGFAIKFNNFGASGNDRFMQMFGDDSNTLFELRVTDNTGNINYTGGSLSSESFDTNLLEDKWYFIEVKVDLSDSAGQVECRVDGAVTYTSTSGIDVINGSERPTRLLRFRSTDANTHTFRLDDLYILDGTGTVNNDFLGDVVVKQLLPTGQGNYAQGVGSDGDSVDNHLLVDEDPADTADYVELENGDRESYTLADLAAGEVPIAVRASAMVFDGDGSPTVDGFLRIAGADHDASDVVQVGVVEKWADWYFNDNPATSAAWAEDDLDGAELGVRRAS